MNRIKTDVKNQTFSRIYLLYGDDDFNKKTYSKLLVNAIVSPDDTINISRYNDNNIDEDELISVAQTMPFFAERRVIVAQNSKMFSESSHFPDFFDTFPDTTYFVFIEDEVDKRSRMYKLAKKNGYVSEMNSKDDEKNLLGLIAYRFGAMGIKLTNHTAAYMLDHVGNDKYIIMNECDKLASYIGDRENKVITEHDIDEICSITLENRIFAMIDDLAGHRRDEAVNKYMDLLSLREAPAKILSLIIRHYRILYILCCGKEDGLSSEQLCKLAKIPSFAVKKYNAQLINYNKEQLRGIIEKCVDCEEGFKTGNLSDQMAVDILICTL